MRKTASPPKKGALAQQPANAIVIQNAYTQGGQ